MVRSRKRKRKLLISVLKRPAGKRKQWTDVSMVAAIEAVREGTVSINKVALLHGVPVTTLKDCLKRTSTPWN